MLPGLRLLFVAIVLSLSLLIFGLGAAALLRSAHEEFVSLPNRRGQPEATFAQPVAPPMLALLRVDPPATEREATTTVSDPPKLEPPSPLTVIETDKPSAPQEQIAALTDAVPEPAKSVSTAATEAPVEAAAPPDTPASREADEPDIKQSEPTAEKSAATDPEKASATTTEVAEIAPVAEPPPMDESARAAALKVATLGGPEVVIDQRPGASKPTATSKRAHHRKRRRIVARPRVVPPKPETFGLFDLPPAPPEIPPRGRQKGQAGPVATAGPSGKPHSAHDPS
jgi:hypothetical protein